jgi:hypothetical protein
MTAIHEIQQVMWVDTPHGIGQALFLIDYGPQNNIIFVVALENDGSIKHYDTNQIFLSTNYTLNINVKSDE